MRLSLAPFIALLVSALSFLFATMTEGIGLLPLLFNLAGLGALAWVAVIALQALFHLVHTHGHTGPHSVPTPAASRGASQKTENRVRSPNEPGV